MGRTRGTDRRRGGSRSGSRSPPSSRSSRRSPSPPAESTGEQPAKGTKKPPAKPTGNYAPTKITAEGLKKLPPIEKRKRKQKTGDDEEAQDKLKKAKASQKTAVQRQRKGKSRDPTPSPLTPPKKKGGKKTTTTAAGSKTKGGRVKRPGQKDTVSDEERRNLVNHNRALAGLIGRLERDDRGAWTEIIEDLRDIDTRLRRIQNGEEFTRHTPALPDCTGDGGDDDEDDDEEPPKKGGRKTTGLKKK